MQFGLENRKTRVKEDDEENPDEADQGQGKARRIGGSSEVVLRLFCRRVMKS